MEEGIFITGASGNTGQELLRLLFEDDALKDARVTCLSHPGGRRERILHFPVDIVEGDASSAESLQRAYRGEGTVIHISSIFHTPAVLAGCRPITRLIVVSSTAVFSQYRRLAGTIEACEREIEHSAPPYTIVRPTMIYGTAEDRNVSRLIRLIHRYPVVPLPASGKTIFQPVHVDDLASCIIAVLKQPASIGKAYNIPGGSAHPLREIVRIIATLLKKRVRTIPVPIGLAGAAITLYEVLSRNPKIRREQILRLLEDKAFDYSPAAGELGYRPMSFTEGVSRQIQSMGL